MIALPKTGGFLPLIPLLAALGAAGSLAGGISTAAKNIHEMVNKKTTGEKVIGKGLYAAPYRKGMGFYLTPYEKKKN